MTKTAKAGKVKPFMQAQPVVKIASNKPGLRICFKSSRAISTIQKMPNGKYVVVSVYEEKIAEFDKYSEAKQEAISAAMLPAATDESPVVQQPVVQAEVEALDGEHPEAAHEPEQPPELQVCHKSGRAISTIQKMPDGRWQVVELYGEKVSDFEELSSAEKVAINAALKQPPRTTKDAA